MSGTVGIGEQTRYRVDIAASEARRHKAQSQGVHS
jgi:hypothetical protein